MLPADRRRHFISRCFLGSLHKKIVSLPLSHLGDGCCLALRLFLVASALVPTCSCKSTGGKTLTGLSRRNLRFKSSLADGSLVAQHCDPPYRAIGYSYTYRIYVFQDIAGYRAIPPFFFGGGLSRDYVDVLKARGGGGVSQAKAALSAIGRYRGVSQLYCRQSRFNGPLRMDPPRWQRF